MPMLTVATCTSSGALITSTASTPAARSEAGVPMLQFPRLLLERSAKQPLVLRNEGILPATVRVTMPRGTPFSCSASGQLIAIEPHSTHTLDVALVGNALLAFGVVSEYLPCRRVTKL